MRTIFTRFCAPDLVHGESAYFFASEAFGDGFGRFGSEAWRGFRVRVEGIGLGFRV